MVMVLAGCAVDGDLELGEANQELGAVVSLRSHYNPITGDNYLTTSTAQPSGYTQIRFAGRIFDPSEPQPPDTLPLYSWYGAARQDYLTTTDPYWNEPVGTIKNNYQCLRLEGYVFKDPVAGTQPLQMWWSSTRADNFTTSDPRITIDTGTTTSPDYVYVHTEGHVLPMTTEQPPALKDNFRWRAWDNSTGSRDLLIIQESFSDLAMRQTTAQLDQLAFGPGFPNVRDFSLENSQSRFAFRRGGVIGPYVYPDDPDTSGNESSYHDSWTDGSTSDKIVFAVLRGPSGAKVSAVSLTSVTAGGGNDNQELLQLHDVNGGNLMYGDVVAFKTGDGRWLRESGGTITADATSPGTASRFTIRAATSGQILSGASVTLEATSGSYLFEDTTTSRIRAAALAPGSVFTLEKNCCPDIERQTKAMITRAALTGYNFRVHDKDGDGTIEQHELAIAIMSASPTGDGGSSRSVGTIQIPGTLPPLFLGDNLVSAMGESASFMTLAHELMHQLGAIDLYGGASPNSKLSTMAATIFNNIDDRRSFMLDAWHRLRLGWIDPEIHAFGPAGASSYQYKPDTNGVRPLIIYDPRRYDTDTRSGEYFLIEFRTNELPGYDQNVSSSSPARGMAVWQISEGAAGRSIEHFSPDGVGQSRLWTNADGTFTPRYIDGSASAFRLRVAPTVTGASAAWVEWTGNGQLRPRIDGGTIVTRPGQIAIVDGMFSVDSTTAGARFVNRTTLASTPATFTLPWLGNRVLVVVPALASGEYLLYLSKGSTSRTSNGHPIEVLPPL
jgi:M6 family metalloprotease-like protein